MRLRLPTRAANVLRAEPYRGQQVLATALRRLGEARAYRRRLRPSEKSAEISGSPSVPLPRRGPRTAARPSLPLLMGSPELLLLALLLAGLLVPGAARPPLPATHALRANRLTQCRRFAGKPALLVELSRLTIAKKIKADRWHGLDIHLGDSLQVIAVTESEFLVQISRADGPSAPTLGRAGEWLRSARGSVQMAAGSSADDARMDFYAAKYGLGC